jgi:hypothetical protein
LGPKVDRENGIGLFIFACSADAQKIFPYEFEKHLRGPLFRLIRSTIDPRRGRHFCWMPIAADTGTKYI